MGEDEEETLARLKAMRGELAEPKIKEHRGRIVKTTGDGLLLEFASVGSLEDIFELQDKVASRVAGVIDRRCPHRNSLTQRQHSPERRDHRWPAR